ncbi:MAG: hypothetical protein FJ087_18385 [Deltaproteobacteria bacterium]|nr:hypothetical protein [Deltaproteobacteria bacterium]
MRFRSILACLVLAWACPARADDWTPRKTAPAGKPAAAKPVRAPSSDEALRYAAGRAAGDEPRAATPVAVGHARALRAAGRVAEAAAVLKDALRPAPPPGPARDAAMALYAAVLRTSGRLATLAGDAAGVAADRPSAAELRVLAEAAIDLGDRAAAIRAYERLVKAAPGDASARARLSSLSPRPEQVARPPVPQPPSATQPPAADQPSAANRPPAATQAPAPGQPLPGQGLPGKGPAAAQRDPQAPPARPRSGAARLGLPADATPAPAVAPSSVPVISPAWTAAIVAGDPRRARDAAAAIPAAELREAALATVALAAGDRAAAAGHVQRGTDLVTSIGRPSAPAVSMLLRAATAIRDREAAVRLVATALQRSRAGTVPAALAAVSDLAASGPTADLVAALAATVLREPSPPHDAPVKGLLALSRSPGTAAGSVREALEAALATSDPALRAEVVASLTAADPKGSLYAILRRSVEDQAPLGAAEIASLARTGSPDALAGVAAVWDRLPPESRPAAVLAASALGGTDLLVKASSDTRNLQAAATALVLLGVDGSPRAFERLAAAERGTPPQLADAARIGLALAGTPRGGPPPPPPGSDCGGGRPGGLLRAASAGPSAVPAILACAWRASVPPEVVTAALAEAADPAAWRREAAAAVRDWVRMTLDGWPDRPAAARDLVDRVIGVSPPAAAAAALAGRDDEVVAAARVALAGGDAARVLSDLSGLLPPDRSGVLGILRAAGRPAVGARVYTAGSVP